MTKRAHISLIVALGLIVTATGCGKTGLTGLVPAEGVIFADGVPLEGANISFFPSSPEGRQAVGRSNSEGKFVLTTLITNDGAFPDTYQITVTKFSEPTGEGAVIDEGDRIGTARAMRAAGDPKDTMQSLLPPRYSIPAASGLTWTLPKKGDKQIRLEISTIN